MDKMHVNKPNFDLSPKDKHPYVQWVIRNLAYILLNFPIIGWVLGRSFSFICFNIALQHQQEKYYTVYKILVRALESPHFNTRARHHHWWFFMRLFVSLMQEQQINYLIINSELENKLIQLADLGPQPRKGYNIAYCYVGFSLWLFERGQLQEAITLIKVALDADPKWGYPQYLIGWYGLFTHSIDTVEHFSKAVELDWSFLHRIRNDKTCQFFPDIVKMVSKKVVIKDKDKSAVK